MANQPTIVVANLDDAKLKASINKMVNDLNAGLNRMTTSTDAAVRKMQASLQSLGDIKFSSGGSDGGSTRRTTKQQEEADAVKKTANAYDQLAQSQQKSTQVKSARESYYAFVQGYKEQANGIASLIRDFENTLTKTIQNRVAEINSQIATSKDKIRALNEELNRRQFAAGNPEAQAQVQRELDKELRTVRELEGQLANVNQQFAFEKTYLASLYGEHYRISNIMREEGEIQRQRVSTENQITAELNKQMQKVFEIDSRKKASSAFQSISDMDSSTLDRAEAKLKALEALKEKVRNTDMFSAKNMQNLEAMISYQKSIVEKHKNAGLGVTKDDEEAIKKAAAAEEQWTEKIKARGQVAQETSRKMLRMLNEEAQAGGKGLMGMYTIDGKEISAVKELSVAIKDMQNAYNKMSDSEKESAIGRALKKDIETTKEAIRVVSAYNAMASGMNRGGVGNQQQQLNIENLRQIIKKLTEDFSKLSIEDVKAGRGNLLIDRIQRTSRALQQLQAQMNRPTSLDKALKLPANTLDEIAYKMQMLSNYRAHLNMFDPKQKEEIDAVNKAIEKLRLEQNKIMGQNKEMLASNNALVRSFNYMKNRLAFYFTVGASTQFVKSLIDIRSQYEMNERALGILINSAERGTQIFKELSEMALVSPYTLIELSSAAKQLVAYDIAAKDVVDTTRRLADMASAVGVPMERLTYALGQIKAYGYLNSRDARMFANAGIPLVKQLADYYTQLEGRIISVGDVYDRMKKKTIDYNDVMAVVTKMTDEGGKFFDFQAKMADSLKVRLANLTLAWNNMMNEIGESRQGMLTATIGGLKELFLHWKEISNVFNGLLLAFGMFKLAQITALAFMGELNTAMGWQVVLGTKLQQKLASLATGYKTLSMGITAAGAAFWIIAADAIMTYNKNVEEIERLNSTIQNGAAEASEALDKLLHSSEMVTAKLSAANGKLSVSEATKTWEVLREQIEMSAASSKMLIAELVQEEDLNKRVSKAFKLAESIQEATSKLSDLNNALDITQDSILWGSFGEGLVEDIEDYNEHLKQQAEITEWVEKKNKSFFDNAATGIKYLIDSVREDLGSSSEEAETEIRNFAHNAAETIKDELGEESLKDKVQVNEAVARVIGGIEQMFPQIRGKGKALFEEIFYDVMSKEFEGSVDKQAFYYDKFLERLKKDHASAFGDVTDDILNDTHTWSSAQLDAIQKTADRIKKDMPEASQDAINNILSQLNSTEFKIRIVAEMATTTLEDVQKRFKDKFINQPWISDQKEREKSEAAAQQRYGTLMRKNGEDNVAYEKRISDERKKQLEISQKNADIIEKNKNKQEEASKAILKDAQAAKNAADQWLNDAKTVETWGGYDFSTKKENTTANKARHEAETELQKALKEELQLIEKVRSAYKELTKAGVTHSEAIESSISGYEKSVANINGVLKKYGLELDLSKFAGISNPHEILAMLQKQLDALTGKAKPAEIQALEVEIKKINLDVEKFDATKITDGLKNELGKVKDEYELALELDANPELGDMFAEMFGIDTDALPQTFAEAFDKANKVAMQKLQELKVNIGNFDLMSTVIKPDEEGKWMGLAYDSTAVQELVKGQKEWRDMYRKNLESTEKMLDDYVKKYGDYSDKMAEIEAKRLAQMKELNNAYYTEEMKNSQEYKAKANAINTGADREKGQAKWEEFKNSTLYITMFENLEYASTKTLEAIHTKLEELRGDLNTLTPEQLKTVTDQYLKIEQQLMKRNPFKGLIKNAKEYAKAVGSTGKEAQERLKSLQKEYDSSLSILSTMKEEKKQMEANNQTDNIAYKVLSMTVDAEDEKVKALKKELQAASELVQKYDLMRKIFKQQASSIGATMKTIGDNLQGIAQFRDTLNSLFGIDASKGETLLGHNLDGVIDGLSKTGQAMSQIVDSATSGNVFGVVGGVVNVFAGIGDSIASIFGGGSAKTKKLNEEINKSVEVVRKLSLAYKDLERAVETEMGSAELQARRQEMANKEAQMRELQRQKNLEEQKRSKDRDDDRIKELESSIKDLQIELAEMADEIAATLLGSKVKDAAEEFVSTWVDAWRAGEDTMAAMDGKFDDMIDNMIMKSVASRVVANRLQKIWDAVDQVTDERSEGGASVTMNELQRIKDLIGDKSIREAIDEDLKALYGALGIAYGSGADKELSALQQGLQGMSESTAGALEAYMNNVSQQVYLQSDLLTQIRDAILGFDVDIQTATLGQVLLQLQNSYQVQMSIQNMLEGALNPSGRAFMVELNS